MTIYKFT